MSHSVPATYTFDWSFVQTQLVADVQATTVRSILGACADRAARNGWGNAPIVYRDMIQSVVEQRSRSAIYEWNYYRSNKRYHPHPGQAQGPPNLPFCDSRSLIKAGTTLWNKTVAYGDAIGAVGFLLAHAYPPDTLEASNALLFLANKFASTLYPDGGSPRVYALPFTANHLLYQHAFIPFDVTIPPSRDATPEFPHNDPRHAVVGKAKRANHAVRKALLLELVPAVDVEEVEAWVQRGYKERYCMGEVVPPSGPPAFWCAEMKLGLFMVLLATKASQNTRNAFHGKTIIINCIDHTGMPAAMDAIKEAAKDLETDAFADLFRQELRAQYDELYIPLCHRCKLFISYAYSLLVRRGCVLKLKLYTILPGKDYAELVDWTPWSLAELRTRSWTPVPEPTSTSAAAPALSAAPSTATTSAPAPATIPSSAPIPTVAAVPPITQSHRRRRAGRRQGKVQQGDP